MKRCGLLGRSLSHSYSPAIHRQLGEYAYDLFEKEADEVAAFLKEGDFFGLNVTVPYKKTVVPFLDALSPAAEALGSVNTVLRRDDGSLYGDNTDLFGFRRLLDESGFDVRGKKVLVLGSGGASVTVRAVLAEAGALPLIISRSGENHYGNLSLNKDAAFIVNTTPVGMFPRNGEAPLDLTLFPRLEGVLDLTYNPARTALMMDAEAMSVPAFGGLTMLTAQAWASSRVWGLCDKPESIIDDITRQLSLAMQNIVLIGMPGCGKSTAARYLGRLLRRPAADSDKEIEKASGMRIPDIFGQQGEEAFRRLESEVLARLGAASGTVIATGGGAVMRPENYRLLHQNGILVWLERDPAELSRRGRPLSLSRGNAELYKERRPLYERFADIRVESQATPAQTAAKIREAIGI